MNHSNAFIVGAVSILAATFSLAETNGKTNVSTTSVAEQRASSEFASEPPIVEFLFNGHQLPKTRTEMRRKYGKPLSIKVQAPVPEDGSYNTVKYPGAVVTYYEFPDGGGHVYEVLISSAVYPVMWGLGVGASTQAVTQRLGRPTEETPVLLNYPVIREGDAAGEVSFTCENGRVKEVYWSVILD